MTKSVSKTMAIFMEKKYHGVELLSHCGGGAYGEVYYCRDISGRELAVKIVSKHKLGEHWDRELRGVTNYRKITENSPELLQIYHVEEDEETFFYTMEAADSASSESYLPDTLALRLKNGPLPQADIFRVLSGIFRGIKTIHDAGFAHRDIKPDNILFVKGVPKLGDIGLMSSLTNSLTQIAGTLDFLPPEVRIADGSDSSARESRQRNDLYAFGKVVYCVVTAQDPHAWPTIPATLPLTLPLKFFLRLSFQLCDKDPARRMDSIEKLEAEFSAIERKLLYGETIGDQCRYLLKTILGDIRSGLIHILRWGKRHWGLLVLAMLCVGGVSWYLWPEPPFDITQQKTKLYTNSGLGLSMTLPFQWDIISTATIQKKLTEEKEEKLTELEQKRWEYFAEMLKMGAEFICCGYNDDFIDNIVVQTVPIPGNLLVNSTEDELRLYIRQLFQGELGYKTEIYEVKRMKIAGQSCIFIDLSHDPDKLRINNYIFAQKDQCFSIALTAKKVSFTERSEQLKSILATLKISEKTAGSCKNPLPVDSK